MTEFSNLGLSPATLEAVAATGYTEATPIQSEAIPVALAGRDILGIAQTGTGKTAAFTLPMIDRLVAGRSKARMPRSLVIEPTRELADQVALAFERYSKNQKLSWALLIGGVSFGDQEAKLDRGVDVLIATPGRLLDHFERGKLLLNGVQIMVVDEADRMLDMGFMPAGRARSWNSDAQGERQTHALLRHHAAGDRPASPSWVLHEPDPHRGDRHSPATPAENGEPMPVYRGPGRASRSSPSCWPCARSSEKTELLQERAHRLLQSHQAMGRYRIAQSTEGSKALDVAVDALANLHPSASG